MGYASSAQCAGARALMLRPKLILADEPVASLDPALRHSVMRHIESRNRDEGMTVVCTLHDVDLIQRSAIFLSHNASSLFGSR